MVNNSFAAREERFLCALIKENLFVYSNLLYKENRKFKNLKKYERIFSKQTRYRITEYVAKRVKY